MNNNNPNTLQLYSMHFLQNSNEITLETSIEFKVQPQQKEIKFHGLPFKMIIDTIKIMNLNTIEYQANIAFVSSQIQLDYSTITCRNITTNEELSGRMIYQLKFPQKYEIWHGDNKIATMIHAATNDNETYRIYNSFRCNENSMDTS
ncbi:13562_t:CDS:2 [Cetraspora pellucida]|uniref:13562_t:CDS:1 n=1 Tax=Cetraspora pellucida TaxID=1433469 RepID=A0A9N9BE55_9GLOM|nr:13562_t:CDS:2 [Cetraspora pellucida]